MNQADQHLINQLVQQGNTSVGRDAFGLLIARYQRQVRTTLFRLTRGNEALVDDLAQDTFLRAHAKLSTYSGKGSFGGWLSKIAYSLFLQHIRKEKGIDQLDEELVDPSQEKIDEKSGAKIDLERAMLHLKLNERLAIDLCLANGYSHHEAASIMDLPLGTVKSHVLRGKEKLKHILESRRP